jgi:hypothetical protein
MRYPLENHKEATHRGRGCGSGDDHHRGRNMERERYSM